MPQVGINSNLIIVPLAEIGRRFSRSDLPLTTSQVLQSPQIPHAQMGMWPGVFIFLPRPEANAILRIMLLSTLFLIMEFNIVNGRSIQN